MSLLMISLINERQCLSISLQGIFGLDDSDEEKGKLV